MKIFKGIAGAPGLVHAGVIRFEKKAKKSASVGIDEAFRLATGKVSVLKEKALANLGEENAKIFEAYEMLLNDSMLRSPIESAIADGTDEIAAVTEVCDKMAARLSASGNEYMRQRTDDIKYIGKILTEILSGADAEFSFPNDGEKYILAARELTPVDTMQFDHSRLAGFICELGGKASHTVILAKSLGIPAVVGAGKLSGAEGMGYLDGDEGVLIIAPDSETESKYQKKLLDELSFKEKLDSLKKEEARTADSEKINICINIGKPSDLDSLDDEHIDGIGLFRTEFLYSSMSKKPTVSEQTDAYREVLNRVSPLPVTIRTIDIGGDKQLDYLGMKKEENPFLGCRGIRLCLANPDIFAQQLEAIILAGAQKSVKLMLPMITSLDEITNTRAMIDEITKKITAVGHDCCRDIHLGIMIETPASAIMADMLAAHCDFFSIGTNDLVQYITAADRGNTDVESVYNPYNPAVLKTLAQVIHAGKTAGIDVSVCGDLAADTGFTALLLGMGLTTFSVPLPAVGRIKEKIKGISLSSAKKLVQKALTCETADEVINILEDSYE